MLPAASLSSSQVFVGARRREGASVVAQGSDWAGSTSHDRLSPADRIALALDGATPTARQRAINAHRLTFHYERPAFDATLSRLRRWSSRAIAVVDGRLSSPKELFGALEIPHVVVGSLLDVPKHSSIIVLGCQNTGSIPAEPLRQALARGATIITSDKSALLEPLREVLEPGPARPARVARVEWLDYSGEFLPGIDPPEAPYTTLLRAGVYLPAGHVPVSISPSRAARADVLLIDRLTGEPIIARIPVDAGTLIHSVPHWWQEGVARTALDRRRLADIPAFEYLGSMAGDVTFGEFQAARTMTAGLLRALRPMLE